MKQGTLRSGVAAAASLLILATVAALSAMVAPAVPAHAGPAAAEVAGTVTAEETGATISGAEVQLWARAGNTPPPLGAAALAALDDRNFGPIPDLTWPAAPVRRAITNAEGGYRIAAAPAGSRAWIVVVAPGRALAMREITDEEGDVAIAPTAMSFVRVVAVTPTGEKPIPGAEVRVFPLGIGEPQAVRLTTGADGNARVALSEDAVVHVSASGYAAAIASPRDVSDGVGLVRLAPAAALAGTVVDESGAPIVGATVFHSDRRRTAAAVSAAGGAFRIAGVPRSESLDRVVATAPGFSPTYARATGGDPPLRIKLAPLRTVEGRIGSPDGKPCVGCEVSIAAAGKPCRTTTGQDGSFSLIDLPAGVWLLSAERGSGNERESGDYMLDLRPGAVSAPIDLRLTSRRPSSVLRLRILDEARKPLSGVAVHATCLGRARERVQKALECGADGEIDERLPVVEGAAVFLRFNPGLELLDEVESAAYTSKPGNRPTEFALAALTPIVLDVRGDDGAVIPPSRWTARWAPMPASPSDLLFPKQREASEGTMRVPANVPFELIVVANGRAIYAARRTASEAMDGLLTVPTVKATKVRIPVDSSGATDPVAGMGGLAVRLDPEFPEPAAAAFVKDGDALVADGLGPGRWVAYVTVVDRRSRVSYAERRFEGLLPGAKDLPAVKLPIPRATGSVRSAGVPLAAVKVVQVIPLLGDVGGGTDESGRFDIAAIAGPGYRARVTREGFATIDVPWPDAGQKLEFTMERAASIVIRRHRQAREDWGTIIVRNAGREFTAEEGDRNDHVFLDDLTPGPVEIIETDGSFRRVTRGEALLDKIVEFDLPPR